MGEIIVLRTEKIDKNIVYDYINDKLFLVEKDEDDKLSWSTYRDAKGNYALILLLFVPFFCIVKNIDVPIIVYYILAFLSKNLMKKIVLQPRIEKAKEKSWDPISHEQASLLIDDFNIVTHIGVIIVSMILTSACFYIEECKFIGMFGILFLGSIFSATWEGTVINYKLVKKLKSLKNKDK